MTVVHQHEDLHLVVSQSRLKHTEFDLSGTNLHRLRLTRNHDELYSHMITEGRTFVTTGTRVTYRRRPSYDGARFSRHDQPGVVPSCGGVSIYILSKTHCINI